jgi:ABC-type branched-subunit amino acid transport system substrate-binding protein/predicted negative regulator of RcsB-dependent stress response
VRALSLAGLLFSLLALGLACATPQVTEEEQGAYDEAVSVLSEEPQEGARRLETFIRVYPRSPLAEQAAWLRYRLALNAEDRARAVFWLGWLVRNYPEGERSDEARVKLARLHAQTGDREMARRLLRDLRIGRLSPDRRRLAYRLLAEISESDAERVQWLAAARAVAGESNVSVEALELMDAEITRVVDGLSLLELQSALELLDSRPPSGRVALRLAEASMDRGVFEDAADDLRLATDLDLGISDRDLLEELALRMEFYEAGRGERELLPSFVDVAAQPVPESGPARGTLGVVLPLSGAYASYGEDSLRGVLLAAGVFDGTRNPELRVVVRDSQGDPLRAALAVRDLAQLEGVSAIVGPLRSSTSEAAARVAQDEGVPLIALTAREHIPEDRPYVFRLRTTPEDEIRYLVDYAFGSLGARRFGVLYPDDSYGRGMRDHFWNVVSERGGWLVAAAGYAPESTDFGASIREMIGYALLTRSEQAALVERDNFLRRSRRLPPRHAALAREIADGMIGPEGQVLPPIVDFDALFIPDGYEQVGLLAPQLAFHELEGAQLLGVGDWLHPELIEIAQEHVSGAVISALFDPNSRFGFVADFVDAYRLAFATEPEAFSAHAYDATNLILVQLANGLETRDEVREGLLRMQAFPGASGVTSVRPDGNARKRPFLLQVRGSEIVPLD